jgi:hypothetical protein
MQPAPFSYHVRDSLHEALRTLAGVASRETKSAQ